MSVKKIAIIVGGVLLVLKFRKEILNVVKELPFIGRIVVGGPESIA